MIGFLLALLALLLIGAVVFYLLNRYVAPALNAPMSGYFMAVCAIIAILLFLYILLPAPYGMSFRIVGP